MTTCVLNPGLIASVHADERGDIVIVLREHDDGAPGERAKGISFLVEALKRLLPVD